VSGEASGDPAPIATPSGPTLEADDAAWWVRSQVRDTVIAIPAAARMVIARDVRRRRAPGSWPSLWMDLLAARAERVDFGGAIGGPPSAKSGTAGWNDVPTNTSGRCGTFRSPPAHWRAHDLAEAAQRSVLVGRKGFLLQ